ERPVQGGAPPPGPEGGPPRGDGPAARPRRAAVTPGHRAATGPDARGTTARHGERGGRAPVLDSAQGTPRRQLRQGTGDAQEGPRHPRPAAFPPAAQAAEPPDRPDRGDLPPGVRRVRRLLARQGLPRRAEGDYRPEGGRGQVPRRHPETSPGRLPG